MVNDEKHGTGIKLSDAIEYFIAEVSKDEKHSRVAGYFYKDHNKLKSKKPANELLITTPAAAAASVSPRGATTPHSGANTQRSSGANTQRSHRTPRGAISSSSQKFLNVVDVILTATDDQLKAVCNLDEIGITGQQIRAAAAFIASYDISNYRDYKDLSFRYARIAKRSAPYAPFWNVDGNQDKSHLMDALPMDTYHLLLGNFEHSVKLEPLGSDKDDNRVGNLVIDLGVLGVFDTLDFISHDNLLDMEHKKQILVGILMGVPADKESQYNDWIGDKMKEYFNEIRDDLLKMAIRKFVKLLDNLPKVGNVIDNMLTEIRSMLAGIVPELAPPTVEQKAEAMPKPVNGFVSNKKPMPVLLRDIREKIKAALVLIESSFSSCLAMCFTSYSEKNHRLRLLQQVLLGFQPIPFRLGYMNHKPTLEDAPQPVAHVVAVDAAPAPSPQPS